METKPHKGKIVLYVPSNHPHNLDLPDMNGSYTRVNVTLERTILSPEKITPVIEYLQPLYSQEEHNLRRFRAYQVEMQCSAERFGQKIRKQMARIESKYRGTHCLFIKETGKKGLYKVSNDFAGFVKIG